MIQVKGIHKSFGENHVLKGVDVDFRRGETNLIIGRSGSGKTVFLKTILGLHQQDQGQIIYDGEVLSEMSKQRSKKLRQEIGMLFQGGALFDSMTVAQNIRFPLEMFSDMTKHEMDERVKFVMNRVRLEGADSKFPSEISGGMQKRVSIARAISMSPKYLFCDEPNSGLDPETAIVIDQLIHEITHEFDMTTIVNTHDMNSVLEIGDHVIFMKEGYKVWEGNSSEVLKSTNQDVEEYVFKSKLFQQVRKALR
ncbi:MAG: ABC transporter ATP-binding protein [Flavobacteriales bacterium]|jgi:phospholipid/cholesterol/gamma-HCH transport system ATP-binding protein|nr:ABC transporter ATP-binding protein [Flavobacteriales bacterium]|tara:strand:- start:13668 stop:14423 length:756 start_codon:yes stop_codon:yes gene_type:complete